MTLRIYLAGSWRRASAIRIYMDSLRKQGFEVDCFCDQEGGRTGFNIAECLKELGHSVNEVDAITALKHPAVADKFRIAFDEDRKWLDWCNCLILLMPAGKSAHLEAGYAKGHGKLFYIFWMGDLPKGEFDNMYQFADGMFRSYEYQDLIAELKRQEIPG
ncbi:hypothetical protein ES703_30293 [subsurface metagenome]